MNLQSEKAKDAIFECDYKSRNESRKGGCTKKAKSYEAKSLHNPRIKLENVILDVKILDAI